MNRRAALFLTLALVAPFAADAADPLPALHADGSKTSISGLSSGAFMAVQYGVAYSGSVMGVGVVAGGPYNCAFLNFGGIATCMSGVPVGDLSWSAAQGFASLGQIDPVAGIAEQRVYVFAGSKDDVVHPEVTTATRDFYRAAGVPARNLVLVDQLPAGHAFIATSFGNACGTNQAPYVQHCAVKGAAYDQPKAILQHIYGPLHAPATTLSGTVRPFDQHAYAGDGTSMDTVGFLYVPKACVGKPGACAVHVVLHGCLQGAQSVGSAVYGSVGYNRWADTNQLIVLYPQVVTSKDFPMNPQGCWDWWGYTAPTFQVRSGVQMSAIKAMVDHLTAR